LHGIDLPRSQPQGTHSCPTSASQVCCLARGFAAQAGWSRTQGCQLLCWEGGSVSDMSPESRDGSSCEDGKQLSLEGTGVCCTPFLLRIT